MQEQLENQLLQKNKKGSYLCRQILYYMEKNKIIQLYEKANHFGNQLGMELNVHAPGHVSYTMQIQKEHLATPIAAHGGAVASLVDGTLGVAGLSLVSEEGKVVSTIEFKVSYFKPVLEGDTLVASGKVIQGGKRILFIECEVVNQNNVIIAKGNGTFNAYPANKIFT